MFRFARWSLVPVGLLGAACEPGVGVPPPAPEPPRGGLAAEVWQADVKPVLDRRCVVCHGCYDAPCQLRLSSVEGVERGASKQAVYHSSRLRPMQPTRLFFDARTPAEWREKGFFSVRAHDDVSLLHRMLLLGRSAPPASGEALPDEIELDITRELSCPTSEEFDDYAREHPRGGMPYAVAPLPEEEFAVLEAWTRAGAPLPRLETRLPAEAVAQREKWERFLNGPSLRERITARYLYEHWFLAHLAFRSLPEGPFFRIVRSRTPPGEPVDVIATLRPYDAPGVDPFWYRLDPLRSTVIHKTHIVYRLDDRRLERLRELFLASEWEPERLPSYEPEEASNPFVAFEDIPASSRYRFLLDDAHYFLMTFIRGPVCRGQVAVDVIQDRFFVTFLSPRIDLSVNDPHFLEETKQLLALPAAAGSGLDLVDLWIHHDRHQRRYGEVRERYYDELDPERLGPTLDWIWDGDGENPNAYLTVFRNFDNATVVEGFRGGVPRTAWVMDFPIFERIYYNLVAGFDVFGNAGHQLATRLYMDHLRMQSENIFLAFLPQEARKEIRASWYEGAELQLHHFDANRLHSLGHGTRVVYRTADPKRELIEQLVERGGPLAGPPDPINRCERPPCARRGASGLERRVERELQRVASTRGAFVAPLPEVSLLRVRDSGRGPDLLYALVHDRFHTNVAFMFGEEWRLRPEADVLTILPGPFGSYPNFAFDVDAAEIGDFATQLAAVEDQAGFVRLVDRWGVRRSSPAFWETIDWLHVELRRRAPTEAGLYDVARYVDP